MSTLRIEAHKDFALEITAKYSDKYTNKVHLKLKRDYVEEGIEGTNEMFLSIEELRELSTFLAVAAMNAEREYFDSIGVETF